MADRTHNVFYFKGRDVSRLSNLRNLGANLGNGVESSEPIYLYARFGNEILPVSQFPYKAEDLLKDDLYIEVSRIDHMRDCNGSALRYASKIEKMLDEKILKITPHI